MTVDPDTHEHPTPFLCVVFFRSPGYEQLKLRRQQEGLNNADNSLAGGDGGQELAPTLALTASLVKVSRGAAVRPAISLPVPDLDVCSLLAWSDLICSFSQWTSIQGVLPVFSIPTPCSCVLKKQFQRIHSYNPTYRKLNLAHFSS